MTKEPQHHPMSRTDDSGISNNGVLGFLRHPNLRLLRLLHVVQSEFEDESVKIISAREALKQHDS